MNDNNVRKILETLTPIEATVLYWQCKKLLRIEIKNKVGLSVSRVQDHIGSAHEKLGFTKNDHSSVRETVLQAEYCETLEAMVEKLKNQGG